MEEITIKFVSSKELDLTTIPNKTQVLMQTKNGAYILGKVCTNVINNKKFKVITNDSSAVVGYAILY